MRIRPRRIPVTTIDGIRMSDNFNSLADKGHSLGAFDHSTTTGLSQVWDRDSSQRIEESLRNRYGSEENIRMQDQDVIREFLVESHENLSRLDQELVELEKNPQDTALLASIFRTIHTIKGTCGFFAFSTLEKITHQAESLLSQLRDGKRELTPPLISLILETVDATRKVLASIEENGGEGPDLFEDITERLRIAVQSPGDAANLRVPDP